VSKNKLDLAYRIASGLEAHFENEKGLEDRACFVIAGDIVHNMAHDVPRPERSTGKMVNGSDMDLVVILEDGCSEDLQRRLDEAIYEEKVRLLIAPHLKEEIDYVVKRMGRVREQVRFNTFKRMTACKILQEGTLLYGSEAIFHRVKTLLRDSGVTKQLLELEQRARSFRQEAEAVLLAEHPDEIMGERLNLFYPSEESDEFE
jgi:hypothetical protein